MTRSNYDAHMQLTARSTHTAAAWCKPAPVRTPTVRPSLLVRLLTTLGVL